MFNLYFLAQYSGLHPLFPKDLEMFLDFTGVDSDTVLPLCSLHLDAVGLSDQLVDVGRLAAQPRWVVLQDHALPGAAVQAVGPLPLRHTCTRPLVNPTTYCNLLSGCSVCRTARA